MALPYSKNFSEEVDKLVLEMVKTSSTSKEAVDTTMFVSAYIESKLKLFKPKNSYSKNTPNSLYGQSKELGKPNVKIYPE